MTFRAWQTLLVALVFAVGAAGASMWYASAVAAESQRKWCGVVSTLDDAYEVTPPQTPAGRKIAEDIARLRADFGCP
ncbi:hypothetical protein [Micromonospora sp. WMMD1082]|uniref:hypothetical protein n=1 Tax=Micromonospora sp. WMMD1082 TaxID=3016104 RepID=UPI0024173056|nr:hypothetical protein [Micromonospora sp. WMMD1082]MDG4796226.1 hypothetical protein [Micromonospora sp. WMMD1082]